VTGGILAVVTVNLSVVMDMALCSLVEAHRCFGRFCCSCEVVYTECGVVGASETSVNFTRLDGVTCSLCCVTKVRPAAASCRIDSSGPADVKMTYS